MGRELEREVGGVIAISDVRAVGRAKRGREEYHACADVGKGEGRDEEWKQVRREKGCTHGFRREFCEGNGR